MRNETLTERRTRIRQAYYGWLVEARRLAVGGDVFAYAKHLGNTPNPQSLSEVTELPVSQKELPNGETQEEEDHSS